MALLGMRMFYIEKCRNFIFVGGKKISFDWRDGCWLACGCGMALNVIVISFDNELFE